MKYKEVYLKVPEPLYKEVKKICWKKYGRAKIKCYEDIIITFINANSDVYLRRIKVEKGPKVIK